MSSDPPRKPQWLSNGFLRFAILLLILGFAAYLLFRGGLFGDRPTTAQGESGTTREDVEPTRAVRFSEPRAISGTGVRLITVHHGRGEVLETFGVGSSQDYSYGSRGSPTINVLFFDPATSAARLLLDRAALIGSINTPERGDDSLRRTISYRIVFADADGDGVLSEEDSEVWVSDVEGRNLRRASPEGVVVRSATFIEGGKRILILATDRAPDNRRASKEQMPQRAFIYDVAADRTVPLTQLDSLALEAGRLVVER